MLRNTFLLLSSLISVCVCAQDNSAYFYKAFSIYKADGREVMAGSVKTFVYKEYYGSNVRLERYTNVHLKPEYLVYELFKYMKSRDIYSISKLYDSSFKKDNFDQRWMTEKLGNYSDIRFRSKFRSNDLIIIRYDFVSADRKKSFPFFAIIKRATDGYYLSSEINASDPFNLIGALSPDNLFQKAEVSINTQGMTPFYFVRREDNILLASTIPGTTGQQDADYAALYLRLEFYDNNKAPAPMAALLEQMRQMAQRDDTARFRQLIITSDLPLLDQEYFRNYYFARIMRIFKNFPLITPLAGLNINGGAVLYFKFADSLNSRIDYVVLNKKEEKYFISLQFKDDTLSNFLQDDYISEAVVDYLKERSF